jgi:hypothetical protein
MSKPRVLTKAFIKTLKPAPASARYAARRAAQHFSDSHGGAPLRNGALRPREYLTPAEVERLARNQPRKPRHNIARSIRFRLRQPVFARYSDTGGMDHRVILNEIALVICS